MQFTEEQLKKSLPKQLKSRVDGQMVDYLNNMLVDPELRESFVDNFLSYTSVLQDGRFKIGNYIDAVRFVSHKLLGATDAEAYSKTFPNRVKRLIDEGADAKVISRYVHAFSKNILVSKVFEQTLIPTHIINAPLHQKALNVLADLMMNAKSEKVRSDSAAHLVKELRAPETTKIEMEIGVKQDSTIDALRASTMELVKQQKLMLEAGAMGAQDVAHSRLVIEGEVIDEAN